MKMMKLICLLCLINLANCFDVIFEHKPIIQEILVPSNLVEKRKVVLNCQIIQGKQPISIEWKFNDKHLIQNDNVFYANTDHDLSVLTIRSLNYDQIGNYSCSASNAYGLDKVTIEIKFKCKFIELSSIKNQTKFL